MSRNRLIFCIASSKELLVKASKIALVVGIILNLINQGEEILNLNMQEVNTYKLVLTFIVPFCVSMYTAVSMKLKFHVGEKAIEDIHLKCRFCKKSTSIKKDEIIPFCTTCKTKTSWKLSSK